MKHPVCEVVDLGAARGEAIGAALIFLGVGAAVVSGAVPLYGAGAPVGSSHGAVVATGGASTAVVLSRATAFVAAGRDIFRVSPTELTSFHDAMGVPMLTLESTVRALALDDERLFAATENGYVCACDLIEGCESAQPRCIKSVPGAMALSVEEDRVALAALDGTIELYSLDPTGSMTRTSRVRITGAPTSLRLSKDGCVVGLHSPGDPVYRGAVSLVVMDEGGGLVEQERFLTGSPVVGVGLKEDLLIAVEANGVVTLFDAAGGGQPVSALDVSSEFADFEYGEVRGIAVGLRGDILMLEVVNRQVVVQGRVQVGEPLISIATSGDHAIAGRLDGGWLGIDTAGSEGAAVVGRAEGLGVACSLASWEAGAAALSAMPVIELVRPVAGGEGVEYGSATKISGPALAMSASGTGAQVAAGRKGLLSLVGGLGTLSETGRLVLPGWANDVVARGEVAYVAAGDAGVVVVAVRTGPSAAVSATVGSLGDVRVVEIVSGGLAAGVMDGRVHVLDVATAGTPRAVGVVEADSAVTCLESDGANTLFVGTAAGDVQAYHVGAGLTLSPAGTVDLGRAVRGLAYDGDAGVLHAAVGGLGITSMRQHGDGRLSVLREDRDRAPSLDVLWTGKDRLSAAGAHGVVWLAPETAAAYLPLCSNTAR